MLMHKYAITRPDYCNSLYYNLSSYQFRKMQFIINKSARLTKNLSPYDRVTSLQRSDQHWLPIRAIIVYKICILTYQAILAGKPVSRTAAAA